MQNTLQKIVFFGKFRSPTDKVRTELVNSGTVDLLILVGLTPGPKVIKRGDDLPST